MIHINTGTSVEGVDVKARTARASMHRCQTVTVLDHLPEISNSLTLQIVGNDERFDLTLFDLPEHVTDALVTALEHGEILKRKQPSDRKAPL